MNGNNRKFSSLEEWESWGIEALRSDHAQLVALVRALPLTGGAVWTEEDADTGWLVSYGDDASQEVFACGMTQPQAEAIAALLTYRKGLA